MSDRKVELELHPPRLLLTPLSLAPAFHSWAPPPPMAEYSQMTGHASYEYAYREPELWSWLLEQRCSACAGPSRHHTLGPSAAERARLEAATKLAQVERGYYWPVKCGGTRL